MKKRALEAEICRRVRWQDLDHGATRALIERAAQEDLDGYGFVDRPPRPGDATSETFFREERIVRADLVARQDLTAAGMPLMAMVLAQYDPKLTAQTQVEDGSAVSAGTILARLQGPARSLLSAERVVLNFLQMLSGIATETRRYVDALGRSPTRLLDTRKTPPGYRALAKYAVACGGGWNHRLGLYDRILIKDNHLAFSDARGGDRLANAVRTAREERPDLPVEVEIDQLAQLQPVLAAGADIVLLDNFQLKDLQKAVTQVNGRLWTEASGTITLDRIPELATLGLDFISTGATVHQSRWVDIGLDWPEP